MRINIPLPTYLIKYLTKTYGKEYHIDICDDFGIFILNVLEKKMSSKRPIYLSKKSLNYYSVIITLDKANRMGCIIEESKIAVIQKFIDRCFRINMYKLMLISKQMYGTAYKQIMKDYLKIYDITEDDIKFETLERDFKRKKNNFFK